MRDQEKKPDVAGILNGLKDFQRKSVDYVFKRLYEDKDKVNRFLIADEVGLGKTLVARGIIARSIEQLWDQVGRIDIVYICSNTDIARQNINRLNVTGEKDFSLASRMTLLPVHLKDFRKNKLNFVSFTPGTSFDLRSRGGIMRERGLLYWMLRDGLGFGNSPAPKNIFQGYVESREKWHDYLKRFKDFIDSSGNKINDIEKGIQKKFIKEFKNNEVLMRQFEDLKNRFSHYKMNKNIFDKDRQLQQEFIGTTRRILSEVCIEELEPDIIIMDEFQRFKNLMDGDNEVAQLAQKLFNYKNQEADAKIILLSATPYKMYTMYQETEDNHYEDFFRTIRFLSESNEITDNLRKFISDYRNDIITYRKDSNLSVSESQKKVQSLLKKYMIRTERLAVSNDRNGMVYEIIDDKEKISTKDLHEFSLIDAVSKIIGTHDAIEYWKSSPYILNIMDRSGYVVKKKFIQTLSSEDKGKQLFKILDKHSNFLLSWDDIQQYNKIDPHNSRIRTLLANTVEKNLHDLLWMPPTYPYYIPNEGPYNNCDAKQATKSLIFSSWQVVPKVISQICSFEAERRTLVDIEKKYDYSEEAKKRRPLLNFTITNDRLTGLSNFNLMYPSLSMAEMIDPMVTGIRNKKNELVNTNDIIDNIKSYIEKKIQPIIKSYEKLSGRSSERWYWLIMVLIDSEKYGDFYRFWLNSERQGENWGSMIKGKDDDDFDSAFSQHIEELSKYFSENKKEFFMELGPPPDDLYDVLAMIALGSPAIISLRSFLRHTDKKNISDYSTEILSKSAYCAIQFRSMFNLSYSIAVIQKYSDNDYWQAVLDYCVKGNLQSVIDEYTHILKESLGLSDANDADIVNSMAEEIGLAVSIRTVNFKFDDLVLNKETEVVKPISRTIRCRFALKFGDYKDDDGETTRSDQVRKAFNSPFQPFILATTSIGQEGLDFHQYCHHIYHWNLPSNPVDMEQREGRVHRYKGHAIRKNCAEDIPVDYIKGKIKSHNDLWHEIFEYSKKQRSTESNDLIPYWIYCSSENEPKYQINRHIPALPMSRELIQLEKLRNSLVSYRMVFGQSRQEDLVQYLQDQVESGLVDIEELLKFKIDLSP